ncbi:hypothetical protein MH928_17210 [Flavobacterium sp. WW92]|uniref:hypothetical protein n=1 Tax=unclassified Flavobacterium TaxID=196869 RepID=UPI0022245E33|nr:MULTISPECIES: hypothetical protein [unclassified Flavobacterium]WDO13047.1 hypothetical protein MH928_17210 [Flavobacterium sp. WW92]
MATAKKPRSKAAGDKKPASNKRKEGLRADGKTLLKGFRYLPGGRIVRAKAKAPAKKTKRTSKKR